MGLAVDAGRLISGSTANDFCLKGLGSNNILFATDSSERLRINSAGQMILGTASNLGTVPPKFTIVNDTNSNNFSECQLLRLNGPGAVGEGWYWFSLC